MEECLLGRTGAALSVVGFGGLMLKGARADEAREWVSRAVKRGVSYFDVGPSYGDAEDLLGPALEPYRDRVFLACKTLERTAAGAQKDLEGSLRRLRTDRFDLYQHHAINTIEEVGQVFGPDGAMAAFLAAQQAGTVRFLGLSSHSEEAALAMLERFPFDSVLFPINWACWLRSGFGSRVAAKAQEKGVGILALKALAAHALAQGAPRPCRNCWYAPVETVEEASLALRFALSRPVTAAVSPASPDKLWLACDAAEKPAPLSPQERAVLEQRSRGLAPVFPK